MHLFISQTIPRHIVRTKNESARRPEYKQASQATSSRTCIRKQHWSRISYITKSCAHHSLARVPVQERLAAEHAGELFRHALEHLLDRRRVADEAHGHLQSLRGDVTDPALHVVRDPLDEVRGVLVLDVKHLLVNLLRRHAAAEETSRREVAPVARISSAPPRSILTPFFSKLFFVVSAFSYESIFWKYMQTARL